MLPLCSCFQRLRYEDRGWSTASVFLHPIQPLAHEGLAESCLFESQKMPGPIEHGERRSGVMLRCIRLALPRK
jgi:hypothetical protein